MNYKDFINGNQSTKTLSHPERMSNDDIEEIKSYIRESLDITNGDFVSDTIIDDTYFQARNVNGREIFYVVRRWWNNLENVSFVDISNGEGTVNVAVDTE